jgi:hypothetical protein
MNNIVLVTSIINTPTIPLSYTNVRSVFTRTERFEQTKKTICSIKEKIPNCKIILVECTELNEHETNYFKENCDYVINLIADIHAIKYIYSAAKAAGEGIMTKKALEFIITNNIKFDNFFKISGRYYINDEFNYEDYNNKNNIFKKINPKSLVTSLYKIHNNFITHLLDFINNNYDRMINAEGYESIFGDLNNHMDNSLVFIDTLGVSGLISVCGTLANS